MAIILLPHQPLACRCSLTAFAIFSVLVLKERLRWSDAASFALIFAGVAVGLFSKPATDPHHAFEADMKAAGAVPLPQAHQHQHEQLDGGGPRRLLELLPLAGDSGGGSGGGSGGQLQQHSQQQQQHEQHSSYQPLVGAQHEDSGDELQASLSTAVLLADDAEVYASSSQQHEVHRREHARDVEGEGDGASGWPAG